MSSHRSRQEDGRLHMILVPLMAQGHMIPAVDMAQLLAERGVLVSVVTTPVNASRVSAAIHRFRASGLPVRLVELPFPCSEVGLPDGCENLDLISSLDAFKKFFDATALLLRPLLSYLRDVQPRPSCLISDMCHPWTAEIARELRIPRLVFHGYSCFALLCCHNVRHNGIHETISDELEPFVVPGLPDHCRVAASRAQVPGFFNLRGHEKLRRDSLEAESSADGVVLNSFDGLEPWCIEAYQQAMGKKAWTIGPLSLSNRDLAGKLGRGDKTSVDERRCLSWLDSMKPKSVVYVSFGSLTHTFPSQLMEIGTGLEASGAPFVWVIKEREIAAEMEGWLSGGPDGGFQGRTEGKGLVIKGWAPQALILSHPAVGGFVTHCGWNSVLEGVTAGLPMITWPHFADQFLNEKLVVEVLQTGVAIGVTVPITHVADRSEVVVRREGVEKAVRRLMDEGEEGDGRRERTRQLAEKAGKAMEIGGSSDVNLTRMIDYISQYAQTADFN